MKTTRSFVSTFAAVALLFACQASSGPTGTNNPTGTPTELPADPVATEPGAPTLAKIVAKDAPTSLIGVMTFANPAKDMANIASFGGAVNPGIGMFLSPAILAQTLGQAVEHMSLGGLDMSKPLRVLLVRDGTDVNLVIVAAVGDQSELNAALDPSKGRAVHRIHNGHTVIALSHVLPSVRDYALTNLLKEPVPAHPTATVNVARVIDNYRQEFAMARMGLPAIIGSMGLDATAAAMMTSLANTLLTTIEETKSFSMSLITDGNSAELVHTLTANSGTSMATFINSQKASDFTILEQLLVKPAAIAMGGNFNWSEAKGFMAMLTDAMISQMKMDPSVKQAAADLMEVMGGGMGVTINADRTTVDLVMLADVTDIKKGRAATRVYQKAYKTNKEMSKVLKIRAPAFKYKGAPVDSMKLLIPAKGLDADGKKLMKALFGKDGPTLYTAFAKGHYMMTGGKASKKNIRSLIARGNLGKAGASPEVAKTIADAKKRKESLVMHMDIARLISSWATDKSKPATASGSSITWGMGFGKDVAKLRITVPVTHVKAIMAASGTTM